MQQSHRQKESLQRYEQSVRFIFYTK